MKDEVDEVEDKPKETRQERKERRANLPLNKTGKRPAKRLAISISKKFSPRFLEDADTRLHIVRLLRKRVEVLMQDAGGDESQQRSLLCKRAAFLSIVLETMECDAAESGAFDIGSYSQSLNCLTGCLKALGLERRVKSAGGLQVYLAEREAKG